MQKNTITNKITPCCNLPFSQMFWWVSNLNLNTEADREFIISKMSQSGTISVDAWKVLINSGELESDAALTKAEFLAWFDCNRQPSCEQLKLIIEGFKLGNYNPSDEYGVGWTEISNYEEYNDEVIKKVINYVGGVGSIPTALSDNIGKYYAADGTFTTNKALATNFKPTGIIDNLVKVNFTTVVSFDYKKKYSTTNQSANLNFTFSPAGLEKNAMYKVEIVSDGTSDITFSTAFEVVGEVDKTKNQVIFFSRQDLVEFKILAVIVNIAKSGQTMPINLDPDAQIYYNKIIAAGATLSNAEINAMNNFYLALKSSGVFSKMKGIYLAMGNTTASRLLNGVSGRPDATLVSGTVTADGIVGVLDSGMKPSEIFALDSFSYGINNKTPIYSNAVSMGCDTSATSGIVLICVASSPSGQFLFSGPNRDIYANAAMADSLGTYVVTRTGAALAKLFKNGVLYFTHTVSQNSATLPNINFAIGGCNTSGTFIDDGRTTKWAFLADGLTDTEAVAVGDIFNNLTTAIGR